MIRTGAMKMRNVVHVELHIPVVIREALRDVQAMAERDKALKDRLLPWLKGDHGAVLLARRLDRDPAAGTFHATLEFTERFGDFLAALRTGNLEGHLG